jgi:hypothetical protein
LNISLTELNKLPYYHSRPTDGRATVIYPFWKDGEFHLPFLDPVRHEIIILKPSSGLRGTYISRQMANPAIDFHIPLLELVVQRLSFPELLKVARTVANDILNFGAVLEKYELIVRNHQNPTAEFYDPSFLVATELEFLFENIRSLYDQLQFIIRSVWGKTALSDPQRKKQDLPRSFAAVVLSGKDDQIHSADEIGMRYGLPAPLAVFYYEQAHFFKLCRAVRNAVVHSGVSLSDDPIFSLPGGFAVDVTTYPYSEFTCWPTESLQNSRLGSVRGLIAHIASRAIGATTTYEGALESCIALPAPIAPDWHVYVRNSYVSHLQRLSEYVQHPWLP